jgi:diguanylate cyclase (GGDEF)-like protein/PAS domain S-box-containing protein
MRTQGERQMSQVKRSAPKRGIKNNRPGAASTLPYLDTTWGVAAYAAAIDQLGIVSVTDTKGKIIHANDAFLHISKYPKSELIGQDHRILNSGHHSVSFFKEMYRTIASGKPWRAPIKNKAKDGSHYWVDALIVPLRGEKDRIIGYLSVRIDITREVGLHIELEDRTRLLQGVVENFPGGISVFDKSLQLIVCNEKQKILLDYPEALFADGPPSLEQIYRFNAQRGEYGDGDIEELVASKLVQARKSEPHSFERRRPNGTYLEVRGAPLSGGGFVSTYLDISDRKRDQETIGRLAHHDALTGLPNRLLLRDRMEIGLARVKRGDTMALFCLDLDRFKSVNDTLGHPVGDALLQAVSKRLQGLVRATDTVARLGGDEFAIIQVAPKSSSDVELVARRIIEEISAPFKIGKHTISIGTSIGIALAPADGTEPEELMKNADLALYRTKANGRGTFSFFEKSMHDRVHARHAITCGLRHALATNGFDLHYQPIINVNSRKVTGCEALIRWPHPERGMIPASEFIPIAEESGLIGQIGDWVLRTACNEARSWPSDVSISVNISAAQMRGQDLVHTVMDSLNGLEPSRLILEITESMLMQDSDAAVNILQRLRKAGVRFALDDFGTGFSSLSYLQRFPFDKLKIDRSFVSATTDLARSSTLRRAIIQLGHNLGMDTVGEGVETEEQLKSLQNEGCIEAQGYLFSKAVPSKELSKFFVRPHQTMLDRPSLSENILV